MRLAAGGRRHNRVHGHTQEHKQRIRPHHGRHQLQAFERRRVVCKCTIRSFRAFTPSLTSALGNDVACQQPTCTRSRHFLTTSPFLSPKLQRRRISCTPTAAECWSRLECWCSPLALDRLKNLAMCIRSLQERLFASQSPTHSRPSALCVLGAASIDTRACILECFRSRRSNERKCAGRQRASKNNS